MKNLKHVLTFCLLTVLSCSVHAQKSSQKVRKVKGGVVVNSDYKVIQSKTGQIYIASKADIKVAQAEGTLMEVTQVGCENKTDEWCSKVVCGEPKSKPANGGGTKIGCPTCCQIYLAAPSEITIGEIQGPN